MIGKQLREYTILSEIGEGGMGTVYLANHSILGQFAIKALAPQLCTNQQFRDRFIAEAKAQFALQHENIVQLLTSMEEDNNLFLVMEYVDGDPLDIYMNKKKKLPETEAIPIFKDILSGLNYAHSKGVIHRDIKPSNIILTSNGTAKIMDFGIALMASGKRMTKTGATMGTSWYMSPEQIANPKAVDHRSDVYSIGVIFYEMLSGKVPFDGDTDYEIYQKHINDKPPELLSISKDIPEQLAGIIHKALEKNPDDRFNGCGELLQYIEAYRQYNKSSLINNTKEKNQDLQKESEISLSNQKNIQEEQSTVSEKDTEKLFEEVENWIIEGKDKIQIVKELLKYDYDEQEAYNFIDNVEKTIQNSPENNQEISENENENATSSWGSIIAGGIAYSIARVIFFEGKSPGFFFGILAFMIGSGIFNGVCYMVKSPNKNKNKSNSTQKQLDTSGSNHNRQTETFSGSNKKNNVEKSNDKSQTWLGVIGLLISLYLLKIMIGILLNL